MSSFGVPTRTVTNVMTAVKRIFGDESGVQLEDNDIILWVNQAQQAIVTKNGILKAKATTPIVAGTAVYSLAGVTPRIYQIDSVLIDGRRVPNMSVAQAEDMISENDPAGAESGDPSVWYEWAGELTFWPKPAANGTLLVRYTAAPASVTAATDLLGVPDDYFNEVVNFVLKQAYEMDENQAMMQLKGQEFDASLAERSEESRSVQTMTYDSITVLDL